MGLSFAVLRASSMPQGTSEGVIRIRGAAVGGIGDWVTPRKGLGLEFATAFLANSGAFKDKLQATLRASALAVFANSTAMSTFFLTGAMVERESLGIRCTSPLSALAGITLTCPVG